MDDQNIIALYWARSETAISETAQKYGGYCFSIAKNILTNHEDAEESVNDTYLTAWNAMPPRRPSILATFLGKITRRLAIDRWRWTSWRTVRPRTVWKRPWTARSLPWPSTAFWNPCRKRNGWCS